MFGGMAALCWQLTARLTQAGCDMTVGRGVERRVESKRRKI